MQPYLSRSHQFRVRFSKTSCRNYSIHQFCYGKSTCRYIFATSVSRAVYFDSNLYSKCTSEQAVRCPSITDYLSPPDSPSTEIGNTPTIVSRRSHIPIPPDASFRSGSGSEPPTIILVMTQLIALLRARFPETTKVV